MFWYEMLDSIEIINVRKLPFSLTLVICQLSCSMLEWIEIFKHLIVKGYKVVCCLVSPFFS